MGIDADTRPQFQKAPGPAGGHADAIDGSAGLGSTVALTTLLLVALFAVVMASAELLVNPKPLPPPLDLGQRQNLETALYLLTFGLMGPVIVISAPRLADRIAASPHRSALPALTALLAATLAAAILVARLLSPPALPVTLVTVGIWAAAAATVLARARRQAPWRPLMAIAQRGRAIGVTAGGACLIALLAFTSLKSISLPALAGSTVVAAAVLWGYRREDAPRWQLHGRWARGLDALIVALILLAVPDLVIFGPPAGSGAFLKALYPSVIEFHQNFVLGPANVVLHGGPVLVDTASQYGVGSIYFMSAYFQVAPIGYGALGLLDGALFALFFAAGYGLLRLAGVTRALAAGALFVGVVALVYNLLYSVGSLPAQHGPLRFGLPMLLILAATIESRWPPRARLALAAQLMVVGVASVWALEGLTYTVATYGALICFAAWTSTGPRRMAWLLRRVGLALAACLIAHLLLIAATLVFANQVPDYGRYLAFLSSFLGGKVGDITYDFSRWSPALAVGAGYAALAIALVLVVRRRPEVARREQTAMTVLCGTTAYGIVLFSYFVDRSANHILPYISLPALLAGTLWLSLLLRGALGASRRARLSGFAFALALAVLVTSVAWSSVGDRFSRSALGHLAPGGESAVAATRKLWRSPVLDPRAPAGETLLARYMPGENRSLMLVTPDLETEIQLRSGRSNALPIGYTREDSFTPAEYLPALRRKVDDLRPGDRLLMQRYGLSEFARLRAVPSHDTLNDPVPHELAPIQEWALQRIAQRFDLRVLHRDSVGFVVAALAPRT